MLKVNKVFILFFISALVFAYMEGGRLAYSIFFCMLFIFVSSIIHIIFNKKYIEVRAMFDKDIYETGDSAEFNIEVKNRCIFPAAVVVVKSNTYAEMKPEYNGNAILLKTLESKCFTMNLNLNKRGIYDFGNISCSIRDFFMIFEIIKNVRENKTVKVYPHIYKLRNVVTIGNENFEVLSSKKGNMEDTSTIDDIRKYNAGDSLRRIHWKVSAKHGELYTKNFDNASGEECNLILDMNGPGYFNENGEFIEERLIELFCSVAEFMRGKGIKSTIYISGDKIDRFDIKSSEDMDALKEYFLYHKSIGEGNFAKFLEKSFYDMEKASWFGVFVPNMTLRIKNEILSLKYNNGFSITVFYIYKDMSGVGYIQDLKNSGVECLNFNEVV